MKENLLLRQDREGKCPANAHRLAYLAAGASVYLN
jgi:hypothetical protein